MILTDKCKEEFEKWIDYDLFNYNYRLDKTMQQSKIIEFFDSVGIYISINYVSIHNELTLKKGFQALVCFKNKSTMFREVNTRTEATQSAITKANEIFNNLNKQRMSKLNKRLLEKRKRYLEDLITDIESDKKRS